MLTAPTHLKPERRVSRSLTGVKTLLPQRYDDQICTTAGGSRARRRKRQHLSGAPFVAPTGALSGPFGQPKIPLRARPEGHPVVRAHARCAVRARGPRRGVVPRRVSRWVATALPVARASPDATSGEADGGDVDGRSRLASYPRSRSVPLSHSANSVRGSVTACGGLRAAKQASPVRRSHEVRDSAAMGQITRRDG